MKVGTDTINGLTPVRTGRGQYHLSSAGRVPGSPVEGPRRAPKSFPGGIGQTSSNAVAARLDDITPAEKFYHRYLDSYQLTLTYRIDRDSGDILAKILERYGREEIRQIPPEHVVAFAARFNEWLGLILDLEA